MTITTEQAFSLAGVLAYGGSIGSEMAEDAAFAICELARERDKVLDRLAGIVAEWDALQAQAALDKARIERLEDALASFINAVAVDISEAKKRLDAEIPKDAPAHPVSAFLSGTAIAVGRARAALIAKGQPNA